MVENFNKLRRTGAVFAAMMMLTAFKISFPVPGASQGSVSVGVTDLLILVAVTVLLYRLLTRRWRLRGDALRLFLVAAVAVGLTGAAAAVHVLRGSSPVEFIGAARNLYACVVIWFLVDSEAMSKEELGNGLVFFCCAECAMLAYSVVSSYSLGALPEYTFPDCLYVSTAGVAVMIWFSSRESAAHWRRVLAVIYTGVVLALGCAAASRTAVILVMFALLCGCVLLWRRYGKKLLKALGGALLCALMCAAALTVYNPIYSVSSLAKAVPGARQVLLSVAGIDADANYTQVLPENIDSIEELLQTVAVSQGSAARSTATRSAIWQKMIEEALKSPLIGSGLRFVDIPTDDGGTVSANAHNFLIEIFSLFGVVGLLCYAALMCFALRMVMKKLPRGSGNGRFFLLASFTIYVFACLQPTLSGGILTDVLQWGLIALCTVRLPAADAATTQRISV